MKYTNDARNLFFTTSLRNSVQTYSSRQFRLLDPLQTHSSPPTVIALSPTSHLLLSASVEPPTIHLTNLTLRTLPVILRPSCSSSAVVAASFHPERANVFLLGFADGVLAIYDAVHLLRRASKGERREGPARTGNGGELGHIKGLHTAGANLPPSDPDALLESADLGAYQAGTEIVTIGGRSSGITAVSFLPGYTARAVSAGADGKCHLIDFEAHNRKESRIVKSWHVRGPATSLSVVPLEGRRLTTPKGRKTSRREEASADVSTGSLIVVGRFDGKVCIFSDLGILQGEMIVDPAGGPILDVEWIGGSGDRVSKPSGGSRAELQSSNSMPRPSSCGSRRTSIVKGKRNSIALSKRTSLGSLLAAGRQTKEEVLSLDGEDSNDGDHGWRDAADVYAAKYMDMFSPVKQHIDKGIPNADRLSKKESEPPATLLEHLSAVELQFPLSGLETEISISNPTRRGSRTADRPRPGPRRGSQAAVRTSQTARRSGQDDGKVITDVRRAAVPGRPARGFALFAPYMERKVMVAGTGSVKRDRSCNQASTASRVKTSDQSRENVWGDVVSSPPIPTRTHSQKASTDVSRKSRKNVSFQAPSVAKGRDEINVQGQPLFIPLVSEPSTRLLQAKDRDHYAQEQPSFEHRVVPRSPKEISPRGFKLHEDTSTLSRTSHPPQRIRTTTNTRNAWKTPLGDTSQNLGSTKLSNDPWRTSGSDKELAISHNDTAAFFNEKLQEAKATLAADMRDFRAEILRQFDEHKRQIGDALDTEVKARQKVIEENRLLKEELSKANRGWD